MDITITGTCGYRNIQASAATSARTPGASPLKINAAASNIAARIKSSVVTFTPMLICSVLSLADHKIHTSAAMSSKAKMIVRSAPDTISFTGSIAIARKANGESARQAVTRLFMVRFFLPFGKLLTPAYLSGSYARRGEYSRAGYPRRR